MRVLEENNAQRQKWDVCFDAVDFSVVARGFYCRAAKPIAMTGPGNGRCRDIYALARDSNAARQASEFDSVGIWEMTAGLLVLQAGDA